MSVELADSTGAIGQAATNTGFQDASDAAVKSNKKYLKAFFEVGFTTQPKKAADEALELAHEVKENGVRSTLINISELLKKAKTFSVVQTG